MKIGIRFPDSDFRVTISKFLELFISNGSHFDPAQVKLSPANRNLELRYRIVKAFNASAPSIYWITQNGFGYDQDWNAEGHIRIETAHVFLGREVDEYFLEVEGYDDHKFHWVDTALRNGVKVI